MSLCKDGGKNFEEEADLYIHQYRTHDVMTRYHFPVKYRVFFLTGPPLKFSKYKISKKYPDWATPRPPQKVKIHGLGLP